MYFLVVVALIGGVPQSLAGAFKTLPECLDKRKELAPVLTGDPSVTHYSIECVKGYEPRKAM
jgi:hypothetical protein